MSSIRTARGGITGLMLLGVCAFGGLRSQGAAPWSAVPQPADVDKESAAPEQQASMQPQAEDDVGGDRSH